MKIKEHLRTFQAITYLKDDFAVTARPWFWNEFWGQGPTIQRLNREERLGNGPKLSLFVGPSGSGKTSAAKVRGMVASCGKIDDLLEGGSPPLHCGDCIGCRQVFHQEGVFHDGYTELVGDRERVVDDIEEAISRVWYRKQHGSDRIPYVLAIDEAGFMPERAYRLLHKLSEERCRVQIILIVRPSEVGRFTEPLRNRMEGNTYRFRLPTVIQVAKGLQRVAAVVGMNIEVQVTDWIAKCVSAEPRRALGALNQLRGHSNPITLDEAKGILPHLVDVEHAEDE